jgi:hypothetical protein
MEDADACWWSDLTHPADFRNHFLWSFVNFLITCCRSCWGCTGGAWMSSWSDDARAAASDRWLITRADGSPQRLFHPPQTSTPVIIQLQPKSQTPPSSTQLGHWLYGSYPRRGDKTLMQGPNWRPVQSEFISSWMEIRDIWCRIIGHWPRASQLQLPHDTFSVHLATR